MTSLTADTEPSGAAPGYSAGKADHLARLARIEGQVRGVARMVDDERYCIDVLTQIGAINLTRRSQEGHPS
jgi:DNA-binding FrmR family transcriptional regulator